MSIKRVVCGISGGVDSCVAAILLKERGFDVTGVFMQNWDLVDETATCTIDNDRQDAKSVCDKLKIPFKEINFIQNYWMNVFSNFVQGYEDGISLNPDVLCNKHIKFGSFFDYVMRDLNADAVATGHYAQNSFGNFLERADTLQSEKAKLLTARDTFKDQTLFLCQISQTALRKTMFPLGDMMKEDVRKLAHMHGFRKLSKKRDSVGICFIGKRKFPNFIKEYLKPTPGRFLDMETGEEVGRHQGYQYYTRGQRTHLAGKKKAYFVQEIQPETADIIVVPGLSHPALFSTSMTIDNVHWISATPKAVTQNEPFPCKFRFQHSAPLTDATLLSDEHRLLVARPMRAICGGQYAVLYSDYDIPETFQCLGSGMIRTAGPPLAEPTDHTRNYVRTMSGQRDTVKNNN